MRKLLSLFTALLFVESVMAATATATLSQSAIKNTNPTAGASGYTTYTISSDGYSWNAYAIKNKHSNATSDYHFLQLKKYASNTASYIQIPTMPGNITSITMTVSSTSQPMTGGGNSATLYFSASNSTSSTGTGVASGTGASSVTIDCSALNLTSGYITTGAGVRVWDMVVTYEVSSTPTISATPTTIDFGTVALGSSVTSKNVAVNFANLTGSITYSGLSSPFSASGSISTTGDEITISANASEIGDYSQTLTIQSAADSKSVDVTVKMKVETPADVTLDFSNNTVWSFPTAKTVTEGTYTNGLTIKVAGSTGAGYNFDTDHLFIGKTNAYITLPIFNDPIAKIECLGVVSGSGSVTFNVYQGESAVSEEVTSCKVNQTFEIEEEDQAADVAHTIRITNDNNARFAGIKIWLKPVTRVGLNPKSLAWGDQKQNIAPEAKTFKLKGSHLTAGLTLAASSGYSVSPTSITADEAMADSVLVTVTPATPTTTGAKNGTITISGGGLTADSVLALSMNVIETFAVNVAVIVKDKNDEIIATPEGISATLEGVTTYYADAENGEEDLALEATTIAGYNFTGWTKNSTDIAIDDASEASTLVDVIGTGTITANFKEKQCAVLATPTNVEVSGLDYPYDGASITWNAVANAASYEVYIKQGVVDVELDEVATNSYNLTTTLAANTTYTYEIIAVPSNKVDYCSSNAASDEFTTTDLPAATITLSENGVTRTWGDNLKITDEIALPTEVVTGVVNKVLVGWSANAECVTAPEYAKGAIYTITTASTELYAVYATRTSSPTFEQLTSALFDEDAIYVIGAEQSSTDHTMWYFNGYEDVDANIGWGTMTSEPATNEPIQLKLSGSASELVVREVSGDQNYLAGLTTGKFKMSSTSTTIALANDGGIKNSNTGSYTLRHNYNGGNGGLRWYSSTTGTPAYFYEYDPHISYSGYTTTGEVPTAIDNTEVEGKAVKVLRNGILYIEKGGKQYNVMGQLIK